MKTRRLSYAFAAVAAILFFACCSGAGKYKGKTYGDLSELGLEQTLGIYVGGEYGVSVCRAGAGQVLLLEHKDFETGKYTAVDVRAINGSGKAFVFGDVEDKRVFYRTQHVVKARMKDGRVDKVIEIYTVDDSTHRFVTRKLESYETFDDTRWRD